MGRIWFRPRIMRDVTAVDFSTRILGHPVKMPIYIVYISPIPDPLFMLILDNQTATALGKLGHPDGELNLTKAAAKHGVIQMVNLSQVGQRIFTNPIWKNRFRHWLHVLLTK